MLGILEFLLSPSSALVAIKAKRKRFSSPLEMFFRFTAPKFTSTLSSPSSLIVDSFSSKKSAGKYIFSKYSFSFASSFGKAFLRALLSSLARAFALLLSSFTLFCK